MKFTPKSERQLKEEMLIPPGDYDFEVVKAEEKVSNSGNPMIAVNLKVFMGDGTTRYANDWLMTSHPSMEYKFRHFCEATDLLTLYDQGVLTDKDCVGRSGKCRITQKDDEKYGPQNSVKDYLLPTNAEIPAASPQQRTPVGAATGGQVKPPGIMDPEDIPF